MKLLTTRKKGHQESELKKDPQKPTMLEGKLTKRHTQFLECNKLQSLRTETHFVSTKTEGKKREKNYGGIRAVGNREKTHQESDPSAIEGEVEEPFKSKAAEMRFAFRSANCRSLRRTIWAKNLHPHTRLLVGSWFHFRVSFIKMGIEERRAPLTTY